MAMHLSRNRAEWDEGVVKSDSRETGVAIETKVAHHALLEPAFRYGACQLIVVKLDPLQYREQQPSQLQQLQHTVHSADALKQADCRVPYSTYAWQIVVSQFGFDGLLEVALLDS